MTILIENAYNRLKKTAYKRAKDSEEYCVSIVF